MKRMAQKEERRKVGGWVGGWVSGWVGGWVGTPGLARACLLWLLSPCNAMGPSTKSHHRPLSTPLASSSCPCPCPAARRL